VAVTDGATREIAAGDRFGFGENWSRFLALVDDERIRAAEESLTRMLGTERLTGRTFVDVGSGSGLFSLAARNLGAHVTSFDYDPHSVACTAELRRRYHPDDPHWTVTQGSALDRPFLASLGTFDVVYSWGVLHHTGDMWTAIANVLDLANPTSQLFISIYNDQGLKSRVWTRVKRYYVSSGPRGKQLALTGSRLYLFRPRPTLLALRASLRVYRRLSGTSRPRPSATPVPVPRGMDRERDLVDWVGGYPFEVATPDQVFSFLHDRGWQLERLKTCGAGLGCNEFVLSRR